MQEYFNSVDLEDCLLHYINPGVLHISYLPNLTLYSTFFSNPSFSELIICPPAFISLYVIVPFPEPGPSTFPTSQL